MISSLLPRIIIVSKKKEGFIKLDLTESLAVLQNHKTIKRNLYIIKIEHKNCDMNSHIFSRKSDYRIGNFCLSVRPSVTNPPQNLLIALLNRAY